jgi:hypothetical protein
MDQIDRIFEELPASIKEMVEDNMVNGVGDAYGAGQAGLGAVVGGTIAVAAGITGLAVPVISMGVAYLAYKNGSTLASYAMRKIFKEKFGDFPE